MKKLFKFIFLAILMLSAKTAVNAQNLGVNTNLLGAVYATPNLGLDIGISPRFAAVVDGFYSPFSFSDDRKMHSWGFQPELRFYPRYRFTGHFVGVESHYAMYDFGLHKYRYKGQLYGGGLTYGYSWMFAERWNLEGVIGLGYTRLNHDQKYDRHDPQICWGPESVNRFGITRFGIKFTYFLF